MNTIKQHEATRVKLLTCFVSSPNGFVWSHRLYLGVHKDRAKNNSIPIDYCKITFWLALKTTHIKTSVCDFPVMTPLSVNNWYIILCDRCAMFNFGAHGLNVKSVGLSTLTRLFTCFIG